MLRMEDDNQQHDGEIVRLHSPENGRSCVMHDCCGWHVVPRHVVRFEREMQEIVYRTPGAPEPDVRIEPVIKVGLILDDTEQCTVGFLPRHAAARPHEATRLHNKFAQVIELYNDTPEGFMRHNKSVRNHCMASYILLDNIPEFE
jgi:hypothetical protein